MYSAFENRIGCSGGAIAAINLALETTELVNAVVSDRFEGLVVNAEIAQLFYNTVHRVNAKDYTKEYLIGMIRHFL